MEIITLLFAVFSWHILSLMSFCIKPQDGPKRLLRGLSTLGRNSLHNFSSVSKQLIRISYETNQINITLIIKN